MSCSGGNLGSRARGRQLRAGVLMGGLALGMALAVSEWPTLRPLLWLLALPIAISSYLTISGISGLCIYQGLTGYRAADYGSEAVLDPADRVRMRIRAWFAVTASVVIACVFTVAFAANG
jgi:hypothetical protein